MKQGEIWLINLDPTVGAEIKKTRPAIIVNHNALGKLPLKIIVPVTEWKDRYQVAPWMIKIEANKNNGLSKTSSIDCFQIKSVAEDRSLKRIGTIDNSLLNEIKKALIKVLSLEI
jgi:mRNA interferase MazF